jgi:predicted site-specific integrase-resolvase
MTEHKLEEIHRYTKYKVVETLIKKHNEGNTLSDLDEVEEVAEDVLSILGLVGAKYYAKGNR